MSQTSSLKRQLLRQAVAENVAVREGRPLPRFTPRTPSRWRLLPVALVPLVVVMSLYLLRRPPEAQAEPAPAVARDGKGRELRATPAAPTPQPQAAAAASPQTFDAPRPIDSDFFPLEVKRIVLDPGHGGEDHGTVAYDLAEKDLTLDIAQRLAGMLENDGFEIHLTRSDDRSLSLRERSELANRLHSDLFVSIHINWLTSQVRGIETYFLGTTEDPELKQLVQKENRGSGYSLADMKLLLEGIYTGARRDESQHFADRVQRALYGSLRRVNPKLKNRGVKTAPFVVLVSTEMPAILAEVSCLSNRREAELLSRSLYREHIAEALLRGIRGYAEDVHQIEQKGS